MSVDLLANKLGMFREIDFRTSSSYFTNFPSWSNSISETFNIPLWKDAPRLWGEIVLRNSHNVVDTPCRTNARNLHMPKQETYLESLQSLRNIPFEGLGLLQTTSHKVFGKTWEQITRLWSSWVPAAGFGGDLHPKLAARLVSETRKLVTTRCRGWRRMLARFLKPFQF